MPDPEGEYYRQWRNHIHSPDDIWNEIVNVTDFQGVTLAPKLQPIETRLVMLQTGMRAPMGIKVFGPDLKTIEQFSLNLESELKNIEGVKGKTVYANRVIGKPYIEIKINREAIARYELTINKLQNYIEVAIGGVQLSKTVEGRNRFGVRVRYPRELRNNPEELQNILIPVSKEQSIPLAELASIEYVRGPQVIKSENTFLVNYITFGTNQGYSEGQVVSNAREYLNNKIKEGRLKVPAGISYQFAGNYQNQIRASKRLSILVPVVLIIIVITSIQGKAQKTDTIALNRYYEMAIDSNPSIQAAYKKYEAALKKVPQAKSLPDPTLSAGYGISPIETRLGAQELRISVKQMFPWFGTLKAEGKQAALAAKAELENYYAKRNYILFLFNRYWYMLYQNKQKINFNQQEIELLKTLENTAVINYENHRSDMVDVLDIQMSRKELITKNQELKDHQKRLQADINLLLNRELTTKIEIPDSLPIPDKIEFNKDSISYSDIEPAARVTAYYSDAPAGAVRVKYQHHDTLDHLEAQKTRDDHFKKYMPV